MSGNDRTQNAGTERRDHRALLKSALDAVERMQARLEAIEKARTEPIAVIGMSCRFPGGANSPEEYWRLLRERRDAVREVPPERWGREEYVRLDPDAAAKMSPQYGGFIEGVDQFDPVFFGIAPREATTLDPQQRLVLEVTWEALERAGYAPDRLGGTPTGVFLGITTGDYAQVIREADPTNLDVYFATGNAHNTAAGRVAYLLGFRGPAMAVDTACSSSLTAIHLACQSLRMGESTLALAGGVNLTLVPEPFVCFSKWGMMAPDGRCKAFDAAADGFVRAEGCGMLVLKRLSDAVADRDPILAVLRGSAVNQDGASGGLTVPNGLAQQAVIRQALSAAKLTPSDIDYVEAHGTGTSLGDPIELEAIDAVLGEERSSGRPLVVGSVKTNIGHLESASGVAGLMKVILSLQHGEIPANLHFHTLNPRITIRRLKLIVPTAAYKWETSGIPRRAGVSSFGFSGTNVHMIVEEAPRAEEHTGKPGRPVSVLTVSAKSNSALRSAAGRHAVFLSSRQAGPWEDYCFTSNVGRSHFPHRLAVVGASPGEVSERLAMVSEGRDAPGVHLGIIGSPARAKVAFLFTGQGGQFAGMGRRLFENEPVFRRALERCDGILRGVLDRPLLSVIYPKEGGSSPIDETSFTQPALFSFEYALSELWKSWGVVPDIVLGHSVGEYVAACVAGVFSLEDGLKLIAARGSLMQALPRGGAMAAVFAGEEAVSDVLKDHRGRVSIAALNAPDNTVISGEESAVTSVMEIFGRRNVEAQRLVVSHAFHSRLLDPMLDPFERLAGGIEYSPPAIPVVSNLTGIVAVAGEITTPAYWKRHVRNPVRFADGVRTISEGNVRIFIEIGPAATLLGLGRRCLPDAGLAWIPSLRRDHDDCRQISEALAQMYAAGGTVDWERVHRIAPRRRVLLPTYPFERNRHWIESGGGATGEVESSMPPPDVPGHPFVGRRVRSPILKAAGFEFEISEDRPGYLRDHRIKGRMVFPRSAYLECAAAISAGPLGVDRFVIEDLTFKEALFLQEGERRTFQTVLQGENDCKTFEIHSRYGGLYDSGEGEWRLHATGRFGRSTQSLADIGSPTLQEIVDRVREEVPVEAFYERLRELGLDYGEQFRSIRALYKSNGEALGHIRLTTTPKGGETLYRVHPAMLDGCFQILGVLLSDHEESDSSVYFPIGVSRYCSYEAAGNSMYAHAVLREPLHTGGDIVNADIQLLGESGELLAKLEGLTIRRVSSAAGMGVPPEDDWLYGVEWKVQPPEKATDCRVAEAMAGQWLILGENGGVASELESALIRRGFDVARIGTPAMAPAGSDPDRSSVQEERALEEIRDAIHREKVAVVVYLASFDSSRVDGGEVFMTGESGYREARFGLNLLKVLLGGTGQGDAALWMATRGAVAVKDHESPALRQTPLWGLYRTVLQEQLSMKCAIVDLDPGATPEAAAAALVEEITGATKESQVAFRGMTRYVPRLVRTKARAPGRMVEVREDATYLVTGGFGGIGREVLRWLADKGARNIAVVGRSPLPAELLDVQDDLGKRGVETRYFQGDVSDARFVRKMFDAIDGSMPPLRGVIHAAGVLADGILGNQTWERFRTVLAPKVHGVEPAPSDPREKNGFLRPVLFRSVRPRFSGAIQLRCGERVPRRPGMGSKGGGPPRAQHQLGPVGRRRNGRCARRPGSDPTLRKRDRLHPPAGGGAYPRHAPVRSHPAGRRVSGRLVPVWTGGPAIRPVPERVAAETFQHIERNPNRSPSVAQTRSRTGSGGPAPGRSGSPSRFRRARLADPRVLH